MGSKHPESNQIFKLTMLGTDTPIEGVNADGSIARLAGYERGESLNAIFRQLDGQEFVDKHIVSGPATQGYEFDQKVAEGVLMALKAFGEGKISLKIAAHSRGAVETIVIANRIQEILDLKKSGITADKFKEAVLKIVLRKTDSNNSAITCVDLPKKTSPKVKPKIDTAVAAPEDDKTINFKTIQSKTPNPKINVEQTHQIDIDKLFDALSEPDKINCELFLIDPVPGQKGVGSWVIDEFLTIPKCVKKIELIYALDERTAYFEPLYIDPDKVHDDCEITITTIRGHHGTASGFYDNQGSAGKDIILSDKDIEHGTRGKKTRHIQKLIIGKLVEFFNLTPLPDQTLKKSRDKRETVPSIEKTINSCRVKFQSAQAKKQYFLKRYEKTLAEKEEFDKFRGTAYSGLGFISAKKRSVLTGIKTSQIIDDIKALHTPPGSHINNEHIQLAIEGFINQDVQDPRNTSYQFICQQFKFFTDCFNHPKGTHQDKSGKKRSNSEVISHFCDYDNEIHRVPAYLFAVLEPFISGTLSALIDHDRTANKHQLVSECKTVIKLVNDLLASVNKYANTPDIKNYANARQVYESATAVKDILFEHVYEHIDNKINDLKGKIQGTKLTEGLSTRGVISDSIKYRKSLLLLITQLKEVRNAELLKEADYTQFEQRIELLLDASSQALNAYLLKDQLKHLASLNVSCKDIEQQAVIGTANTIKHYNLIAKDIGETQEQLKKNGIEISGYTTLRQKCKEMKKSITLLKESYQLFYDAKKEKIAKIHDQFKPSRLEPRSLESADDICKQLLKSFQGQAANNHKLLSQSRDSALEKLKQEFDSQTLSLIQKEKEIEMLEMLCDEKIASLRRLASLDAAGKDNEAVHKRAEQAEKQAEETRRLLEEMQARDENALKQAEQARKAADEAKDAAGKVAEEAKKQASELGKQVKDQARQAKKDQKKLQKQADKIAEIKKDVQDKDAQIDDDNNKIASLKKQLRVVSFDEGLKRLKKNIGNEDQHTPDDIELMQAILKECNAIAITHNEATKLKLAHTLNVVNHFVEEPNLSKRNYQALSSEAKQYTNSKRKSFNRLGGCLLVLGILSIATLIIVSTLTFGVALVPLSLTFAAIFAATLATVSAGSGLASGFSLHAAKQPKIHKSLKSFGAAKP